MNCQRVALWSSLPPLPQPLLGLLALFSALVAAVVYETKCPKRMFSTLPAVLRAPTLIQTGGSRDLHSQQLFGIQRSEPPSTIHQKSFCSSVPFLFLWKPQRQPQPRPNLYLMSKPHFFRGLQVTTSCPNPSLVGPSSPPPIPAARQSGAGKAAHAAAHRREENLPQEQASSDTPLETPCMSCVCPLCQLFLPHPSPALLPLPHFPLSISLIE